MAGDMMLLMRGLAKLSQAVVETQSTTMRSAAGVPGVGAAVQSVQSAAEQGLSAAMMKMQEVTGQQQTSSSESEFDFPQDDFTTSEFREEDFTADHTGSSDGAGTHHGAGEGHVSGKQSLFDGYKDPSKQFSGHTRSYHQDARRFIGHQRLYNHSLKRHLWGQLYCQHQVSQLRSYHQDPSTVGGLTA
ncbi:Atypical kinase COQ8A, mitochondrial [Larimichthys crocea]|uniref:Uncharacterized protein n=1 Tax=Larimichthys crocea TaxID=215358 RepID=A0ACD3QZZ0_LARCR|nr:Atypical kinase COQ8A, mitochondrial [Larimichthys crocea]